MSFPNTQLCPRESYGSMCLGPFCFLTYSLQCFTSGLGREEFSRHRLVAVTLHHRAKGRHGDTNRHTHWFCPPCIQSLTEHPYTRRCARPCRGHTSKGNIASPLNMLTRMKREHIVAEISENRKRSKHADAILWEAHLFIDLYLNNLLFRSFLPASIKMRKRHRDEVGRRDRQF